MTVLRSIALFVLAATAVEKDYWVSQVLRELESHFRR